MKYTIARRLKIETIVVYKSVYVSFLIRYT